MSAIQFRSIDSPVGLLTLAGRDGRLMHLRMVDQTYEPSHDGWESDDAAFPDAVEQLESYFTGELFDFELQLDLVGTAFQRSVWAALLTIPYGETRSYGEIAAQIGSPAASRAVGFRRARSPNTSWRRSPNGQEPARLRRQRPRSTTWCAGCSTRSRRAGADKGLFGVQDPTYDGAFRQGLALGALAAVHIPKTDARVVSAASRG